MKYKTILLDVDNTLLDFRKSADLAMEDIFKDHGLVYDEQNKKTFHKINDELWEKYEKGEMRKEDVVTSRFVRMFSLFNIQVDGKQIDKEFIRLIGEKVVAVDGAKGICEYLSQKYDLYIVSNGIQKLQEHRLEVTNLIEYFKGIYTSELLGYQKPTKEFFELAFEKIGDIEKEESIIIGDSLSSDIQGGINFKIDTCWYNPEKQKNTSKRVPTYEVNSLEEIKEIL